MSECLGFLPPHGTRGTVVKPSANKDRARSGRWNRRLLIGVAAFFCLLSVAGCTYHWIAAKALEREVNTAARNPETGILLGAEPITLGSGYKGVLLLHGFVGSPKDFGGLSQRLADAGYLVHAPLLPGHGTRPQDLLVEDPDTWFAAAEEAYRDLRSRCNWVAVVGFSMGGTLAVGLFAESETRQPDALVLACPFLGATRRWYAVLPLETWNRLLMPVFPYVVKGTAFVQINRQEGASEIISYRTIPTYAIDCLSRAAARVRRAQWRMHPGRTLLLYSTHDGAASPRRIRKIADRWGIPDASRVVLTNSNHHIFWDHDCEQAIDAVMKFLDEKCN